MRSWILHALTPIVCVAALLAGAIALGRGTRAALYDRAAFTVAFADIECQPPDGVSRQEFLSEVRKLARQPERLQLLDGDLSTSLSRAFSAHPSVESVGRISVHNAPSSASGSRATVHVEFRPREPVLAVSLTGDRIPRDGSSLVEIWSGLGRNALVPARMVDRNGILLPVSALRPQLPVLVADVATPGGSAGASWGDRRVTAAASVVSYLRPHLSRLGLVDCDVEIIRGEIVFHKPGLRVVWGHAPGYEESGEAPAEMKLRRLLDYHSGHDGLDSLEHDVRLLAFQGHFPLTTSARPAMASAVEPSTVKKKLRPRLELPSLAAESRQRSEAPLDQCCVP